MAAHTHSFLPISTNIKHTSSVKTIRIKKAQTSPAEDDIVLNKTVFLYCNLWSFFASEEFKSWPSTPAPKPVVPPQTIAQTPAWCYRRSRPRHWKRWERRQTLMQLELQHPNHRDLPLSSSIPTRKWLVRTRQRGISAQRPRDWSRDHVACRCSFWVSTDTSLTLTARFHWNNKSLCNGGV